MVALLNARCAASRITTLYITPRPPFGAECAVRAAASPSAIFLIRLGWRVPGAMCPCTGIRTLSTASRWRSAPMPLLRPDLLMHLFVPIMPTPHG